MNTGKFITKSYTTQLAKFFQGIFVFIFAVSMMGVSPPAMVVAQEISSVAPIIIEGDSIEVAMSEDGSPVPFSLTLHATDGDVDDTLTWSVQTDPTNGAASANGTGPAVVVNYAPDADYAGSDSFVVAVTDGTFFDTILVNVTINARNDPPVAVDDEFYTPVDTDIYITQADLVINDLDVDGDPLLVESITNITNGNMAYWWFTPTPGFSGEAGFDYVVSDGQATDTGHTTIYVGDLDNTPPVLTVTGATDGGAAMAGDLETGFILETENDPAVDHSIQFAAGTMADEPLAAEHFGLYLTASTVDPAELIIYYTERGVPADYLAYLTAAANGTAPFVFINGSTVKLVDGAKYVLQAADFDMAVPDDFPLGTYTVSGEIADLKDNKTTVTLILIVSGDREGPVLNITGATADGEAMAGDLATGFILPTTNNPAKDRLVQVVGTTSEALATDTFFGLKLTASTVTPAALEAYYTARGVPEPFLSYLIGAANGTNPFVYITGSGLNLALVDAAKHDNGAGDVAMTVPDNFPLGTYTVAGVVKDAAGNETAVTLKLVVSGDREGPVLNIAGATADGEAMAGNLATGFILETGNDPAVDHLIQFAAGTAADETLAAEHFGLYLTGSTVSVADLKAYYAARGVPAPYMAYLNGAVDGVNPFVYINGGTVKLVDGAKYFVQSEVVDMTVPDDFPLGTYTVSGEIADLMGNETTVTLKLIVSGDRVAPVLTVTGATDGGAAMAGNLATGFILETGNDPAVDHLIQFEVGTTADETLAAEHFGLYLTGSTVSAAVLKAYYAARGVPDPYLAYLNGAVDGDNPFVYINGSTVKLADGAKYFVQSEDVDMTVPDDFPLGTYTVEGKIADPAGNETAVKLILIVSGDRVAPVLTVTGATDGGTAMAGDLATGFILVTKNDPAVNHLIQFAVGTTADETLAAEHFGLYLTGSTVSVADLKAYYVARGVPAPYLAYLNGAADGLNPFVYINGSTVKLVDGAKYFVQSVDVDMTVPDDFPLGTYTVEGKIADLEGNETAVKLILIVTNPNDPPAFVETDPQAVTMSEDGYPKAFSLTLHVNDPDLNNTLTWSVLVPASHGTATASGTGPSKVIGYIPTANYFGSDTFTVQVTDGEFTDTIVVNVTIESVNDLPTVDAQTLTIHEGESIGIHLTASDLEGDPLTFTVQAQPAHGTLSGVAPDLVYTPADNYTGWDSFMFNVFDGTDYSQAIASVSILVKDPTPWMDEKLTTSKVIFNWKDTPGATRYRMELSTKADFSTVVFSVKTLESKYPYGTALKPSKTYYWRVKAKVGGVWENAWTIYKFYSMDPLTAPVLTSPAHKALINNPTPLLEWQKVDNAVSYRVVISNSKTFAVKLQKITVDDPHLLAAALPDGKYYWRVRAIDASGGKGPWSEIRSFTILD